MYSVDDGGGGVLAEAWPPAAYLHHAGSATAPGRGLGVVLPLLPTIVSSLESARQAEAGGAGQVSAVRLRPGLLAQLRRSAGLSQAEVAARVEGLQREQNLGDWERARAQPHPRFIPPLAAVLGVEPLSLLDVDPEDPPLEALRLAVGLSQLELEVRSGVHRTTYARLEKGTRQGEPEPATIEVLASALGVTPERFVRATRRSRHQ